MKNWLENQFHLSSYGTDVKTELLAGLTTFVTMAYVLATVPSLLGNAGLDQNVMFTAMILLIILTTCAMALFTNRPFALAPGLGSVGIVASMIANEGISAPVAAGVIFWSGVLFIAISFLGLREAVVRTIPVSLKQAVSAGIGLFIALLGAKNCGLIVADANKNNLAFGDLSSPGVIVAVIGFIILLVIRTRNVPGGMILAILITTVIGIPFGVTRLPSSPFSLPAGIGSQFMNIDFIGYIEPHEIPNNKADVIVADGFTGNIALKSIEGTARLVMRMIKNAVKGSFLAKIGLPFMMGVVLRIKKTMDPRLYNGAMFVGLNGLSVKSHGGTDALGFSVAVNNAASLVRQNFVATIRNEIEKIDLDELSQEAIYDLY